MTEHTPAEVTEWPPCLGPRGDEDILVLLDTHPNLEDYATALADSAVGQPAAAGIFYVRIEAIMAEASREIRRLRDQRLCPNYQCRDSGSRNWRDAP